MGIKDFAQHEAGTGLKCNYSSSDKYYRILKGGWFKGGGS